MIQKLIDGVIYPLTTEEISVFNAPKTLTQLQNEIIVSANNLANYKRGAITAGISPAEMAGWSIKRQEAIGYQTSGVSVAPNLVAEAQVRGIPIGALVQKVLANANQLLALESAIAGRRGAIQDAALAATTTEQLLAIDVNAGWPV